MGRIVRLTESDLARIVRRVISEGVTDVPFSAVKAVGATINSIFAPNETKAVNGKVYNFSSESFGKILSATVAVTAIGKRAGLTAANLTVTTPVSVAKVTKTTKTMGSYQNKDGYQELPAVIGSYVFTFKAPNKQWINNTGEHVILFEVTVSTNDQLRPSQMVLFAAAANTQFGAAGAAAN